MIVFLCGTVLGFCLGLIFSVIATCNMIDEFGRDK